MSVTVLDPHLAGERNEAWYCIYTHPQQEFLVGAHLRRAGFETFLPTYLREYRRLGIKLRPLFPRYLFVRFDAELDYWLQITYTTGVRRLFSSNPESPMKVPEDAILTFQEVSRNGSVLQPKDGLEQIPPGCQVRIKGGHFSEKTGICSWSDETRVRLLMEVMNRVVEVTFVRSDVVQE